MIHEPFPTEPSLMEPLVMTRMTAPTQQDTAPYGTKCLCHDTPNDVWIQMSHDEEHPNWVSFQK